MSVGVGAVRAASAIDCNNNAVPQPGVAGPGSLLPVPAEVSGDAMMAMMALMSKGRQIGKQEAQARMSSNNRERKKAIAEELRAWQDARRARDDGGFWGTVKSTCSTACKIAAVAGAISAAVATGGAGTPGALAIAGAVLSSGAFAQGETKFLQELGMSDNDAAWVQAGMELASAGCTLGASMGAANAERAIAVAAKATSVAQGGVAVAGGVAAIKESNYQADAIEHDAEGTSARLAREKLERMLRQLLVELEQDDQSAERAMGSLRQAIEIRGNTLMTASMMRA